MDFVAFGGQADFAGGRIAIRRLVYLDVIDVESNCFALGIDFILVPLANRFFRITRFLDIDQLAEFIMGERLSAVGRSGTFLHAWPFAGRRVPASQRPRPYVNRSRTSHSKPVPERPAKLAELQWCRTSSRTG